MALAALALVVFGAYDSHPKISLSVLEFIWALNILFIISRLMRDLPGLNRVETNFPPCYTCFTLAPETGIEKGNSFNK